MSSKIVYLKDYQKGISINKKDLIRIEMREKMRIKIAKKYKKEKRGND